MASSTPSGGECAEGDPGALAQPLGSRHLAMISIGGIIGSGLFVGSSAAIAAVGPAILVSYALAGLIILMVMRMLGEMAVARHAGAFTEHIRDGLGDLAGFTSGWLYWVFWVLAIGLEALAGASILTIWTGVPVWLIGLALIAAMACLNLISTRIFGESEFWLSTVKIVAILLFILAGLAFIAFGPGSETFPDNLHVHGGFAPNGTVSIFSGVTAVILALVGAEIITIAAAESREGAAAIRRLASALIVRVALFYLLSMFVIVAIVPWSEIRPGDSPFAMALDGMGVPAVSTIMNLVILVAVLSCMNSGIYVCSRVLLSLVARGEAPRALGAIGRRRVPVRAILVSTATGAVPVLLAALSAERLFAILVNAIGMVMLIVYILLAVSHHVFVRRGGRSVHSRWTGIFVAAVMAAVVIAMIATPEMASQAYAGLVLTLLIAAGYGLLRMVRTVDPAAATTFRSLAPEE